MTEEHASKCGRRYDAEFKQQAVGLVQTGRTIKDVAGDLGISTWSLREWVKRQHSGQSLSEPKTVATETPEQRENRRLRQELDYLRRQRDILKKALAIVSDSNLNGASNS
jgi:transposase